MGLAAASLGVKEVRGGFTPRTQPTTIQPVVFDRSSDIGLSRFITENPCRDIPLEPFRLEDFDALFADVGTQPDTLLMSKNTAEQLDAALQEHERIAQEYGVDAWWKDDNGIIFSATNMNGYWWVFEAGPTWEGNDNYIHWAFVEDLETKSDQFFDLCDYFEEAYYSVQS